jgi:nucleotide-binding universal stress UspA family protein
MGTHGRSGFERLLLGSITEKVLRKAGLSGADRAAASSRCGARGAGAVQTDSLPVDFSDCSMQALNYAMSLAQEADAHLTVVHVMTYGLEDTPELYDTMITDSA